MGKFLPISGITCVLLLAVFVSGIAAASPSNASTTDEGGGTNGTVVATTWNNIKFEGLGGECTVRCAYRDKLGISTMGAADLRKGESAVWRKTLDDNEVLFLRCDFLWNRRQEDLVYYLYTDDQRVFHDYSLVTTWSVTEVGLSKQNDDGMYTLVQEWS